MSIHHVIKEQTKHGSNKAYCGRIVWRYDIPIDLEHAKACIEQGTLWEPCKKCMKAALKLEQEQN